MHVGVVLTISLVSACLIVIYVFIEVEICQNIFAQSFICEVLSSTNIKILEIVMPRSKIFVNEL